MSPSETKKTTRNVSPNTVLYLEGKPPQTYESISEQFLVSSVSAVSEKHYSSGIVNIHTALELIIKSKILRIRASKNYKVQEESKDFILPRLDSLVKAGLRTHHLGRLYKLAEEEGYSINLSKKQKLLLEEFQSINRYGIHNIHLNDERFRNLVDVYFLYNSNSKLKSKIRSSLENKRFYSISPGLKSVYSLFTDAE